MTDQELLALLDRVGGWVRWDELLYQVAKQNGTMPDREVWDRLRGMRERGEIRVASYFAVSRDDEDGPQRRREAA